MLVGQPSSGLRSRPRQPIEDAGETLLGRTATYHMTIRWTGEHWGHIVMGNGPEMPFSTPPDAQGQLGVLTPDVFVAAVNTCIMIMSLPACERFKLKLVSFECRAEGTKLMELDRTETYTKVLLKPVIRIDAAGEDRPVLETRTAKALAAAHKYSLVANSVISDVVIEPEVTIY